LLQGGTVPWVKALNVTDQNPPETESERADLLAAITMLVSTSSTTRPGLPRVWLTS
jgi:hypothetical protein